MQNLWKHQIQSKFCYSGWHGYLSGDRCCFIYLFISSSPSKTTSALFTGELLDGCPLGINTSEGPPPSVSAHFSSFMIPVCRDDFWTVSLSEEEKPPRSFRWHVWLSDLTSFWSRFWNNRATFYWLDAKANEHSSSYWVILFLGTLCAQWAFLHL